MKDNMPTLKEIFEQNEELREFFLGFICFYLAGYTMEDFKEFADDALNDEELKETIESFVPLIRLMLKEYKKED